MIDLTPLEVRKKKGDFRRIMRGYDPALVDDFLDLVADRLEEVVRENLTLAERVGRQDQQVTEYRERERALTEALVTAQEMREEMRQQTSREADLVRRAAEQQAAELRSRTEHEMAQLRALVEQEVAQLRSAAQQESAQLRSAAQQETAELRSARRQEQVREEEAIRQLRVRHEQFLGTYRAMLERELTELGVATRSLGLAAAGVFHADAGDAPEGGNEAEEAPRLETIRAASAASAAPAEEAEPVQPPPAPSAEEPVQSPRATQPLPDEAPTEVADHADFRIEGAAVSAEAELFAFRSTEPSPAPDALDVGPMFPDDVETGTTYRLPDDGPDKFDDLEGFDDLDLDDLDLGGFADLDGFEAEPVEPFAPEPYAPDADADADVPEPAASEPRAYDPFAPFESLVDAHEAEAAWQSTAAAGQPEGASADFRPDAPSGPGAAAGSAGDADVWDPMQDAFEMYDHIAADPVDDGIPGPIGLAQEADEDEDDAQSALLRNAAAAGFRLGDELEDELLLEDAVSEGADDTDDDDGWLPSLLDDEK
jgi:cell division initiation protein